LSYKIIGVVFDVFNELGYGYQEKYYQKAVAKSLTKLKLSYKEQVPYEIKFEGETIGRYFFDFLIEGMIVLEIKKETNFRRHNIEQVIVSGTLTQALLNCERNAHASFA
jgi:GxxExxY protein